MRTWATCRLHSRKSINLMAHFESLNRLTILFLFKRDQNDLTYTVTTITTNNSNGKIFKKMTILFMRSWLCARLKKLSKVNGYCHRWITILMIIIKALIPNSRLIKCCHVFGEKTKGWNETEKFDGEWMNQCQGVVFFLLTTKTCDKRIIS